MLKDQEKAITPSPKVGQGITMQYIGDKKNLRNSTSIRKHFQQVAYMVRGYVAIKKISKLEN